ncbi:MAG: hypothetical protein KatS3mg027_0926 [Bacteroidia bacterium]|nr:MAG: hypothetical protein KatS3mg027_0926 [Bacteroidia bacterium]
MLRIPLLLRLLEIFCFQPSTGGKVVARIKNKPPFRKTEGEAIPCEFARHCEDPSAKRKGTKQSQLVFLLSIPRLLRLRSQ